jgi:hypothetical protein
VRTFLLILSISCLLAGYAAATVHLRDEAGAAGLSLGAAVDALGDQDGDGRPELLIGAPGYQQSGQDAGRLSLWFGSDRFALNADRTWVGAPGERFGHAVAAVGDLDGDGREDFAVGAPDADNAGADAGRVYIFLGADPLPGAADIVLDGPQPGGRFGWSIAGLGDFDGDGRDDLAVGAPYTSTAHLQGGAVYVYFGGSGGVPTTPDLVLSSHLAYEHLGWSVAGPGAFLGGGVATLAAGAPSHDTAASAIAGAVYIYRGSSVPNPGPDATADLVLRSDAATTADNEFGFSVAAVGSFDGDGDPDLAVGAPFYDGSGINRGRVEIFFGGADADDASDRHADGPSSYSRFGWSVAGAGDITGSSLADVLVGAPYDDTLASDAGRAFLWPGGYGDIADADVLPAVDRTGLVAATAADDLFGYWCAGAGDVDGDGDDDYLVGAPGGNVTTNAVAGWVRLIDSSGTAVAAIAGGWSCRWDRDGGATGALQLLVPAARVAHVSLVRWSPGDAPVVVYSGAPTTGAPVAPGDGGLVCRDVAADGVAGSPTYDLTLTLDDGNLVQLAALAGPSPVAGDLLLTEAFPNPFNPATTVRFLATAGEPVRVEVHDLRGRLVRRLLTGAAVGAWQSATWDGRDGRGAAMPAGVYMVSLRSAGGLRSCRVTLVE